ncbi:MAG: hypothetical protein DWI28_06895 [Planctomycetota bacterium]|nr:MAG: hypothetical protein DWI28_06895 [Planctomycetota bacterium]
MAIQQPDPSPIDQNDSHTFRAGKSAVLKVEVIGNDRASMREAMDPANESLGEALRLSYRLLQVAIAGLIVTFFVSGFQSIPEGVTGIRTIFGRVAGESGNEIVTTGLQPFWPYPIGEFSTMQQRKNIEVRETFWPFRTRKDGTIDGATQSASSGDPIRPGRDGSVITADGDLVHLQLSAEYSIVDPVAMLTLIGPDGADILIRSVLRRAVVQTVAQYTLSDLLEQRDTPALEIRQRMQESIDKLQAGIQIGSVVILERTAPFAVRGALQRVQTAREDVKTILERARQDANAKLVGAAGPKYGEILQMIHEFELLLTSGDQSGSDKLLRQIGERFEQPDIGGQASRIIMQSRAYQSTLVATLAKDSRRLLSLSSSFKENPRQLVQQLWLDAVRQSISQNEVEVLSVPDELARYVIRVQSSPEVMQTRRDSEIARKKMAAQMIGGELPSFELGSRQIMIDRPGRRLEQSGDKGFGR